MVSSLFKKWLCLCILLVFTSNVILPAPACADALFLPDPRQMLVLSPAFNPVQLKGIKVDSHFPLSFEFILDKGDEKLTDDQIKANSSRLIKYFLASLTVPEKDLWVNLSAFEKDRIVPELFGQTEMGRDLLVQDYLLKQITASLLYPEGVTGKVFWEKIYALAHEKYGTTDIPLDTFNKVWIVPEKADVYENDEAGTAYVMESRLKVMIETDYFTAKQNGTTLSLPLNETQELARNVLREIVIPVLEKEVNEGHNFSQLRQVYQALILAIWYKRKTMQSPLYVAYVNRNKTSGLNVSDPKAAERIWEQYADSYKEGVFNFIKNDKDVFTDETIPRRYFSGGVSWESIGETYQGKKRFDIDSAMMNERASKLISVVALVVAVSGTVSQDTRLPNISDTLQNIESFIKSPGKTVNANQYYDDLMNLIQYVEQNKEKFPLYYSDFWQLSFMDLSDSLSVLSEIVFDEGSLGKEHKFISLFQLNEDKRQSVAQFTDDQKRMLATRLFNMSVVLLGPDFNKNLLVYRQAHKGTLTESQSSSIRHLLKILRSIASVYPDILEKDLRWADALEEFALGNSFIYEQGPRADEVKEILMALLIGYKRHEALQRLAVKYFSDVPEVEYDSFKLYGKLQVRQAILEAGESPSGYDYFTKAKNYVSVSDLVRILSQRNNRGMGTYFTGSLRLLFDEYQALLLDHYFDLSRAAVMGDDEFSQSLEFISFLSRIKDTHSEVIKNRIVAFIKERIKSRTIADIDEILRVYSIVAAGNIEWLLAILPEIQHVFNNEVQSFDGPLTVENFMAQARLFTLYQKFKDVRTLEVSFSSQRMDDHIMKIMSSGVLTPTFLSRILIEDIISLGLAVNFVRQFPDSDSFISVLMSDVVAKFIGSFDVAALEVFRTDLNKVSAELGDKMLIRLLSKFVDNEYVLEHINISNVESKFREARKFYYPSGINRDVVGIYRLMANFMLTRLSDYVKQNLQSLSSSNNSSVSKMVEWLVDKGFIANKDPILLKAIQSLGGNWKYLVFKIKTKFDSMFSSPAQFDLNGLLVEVNPYYKFELGAEVFNVVSSSNKKELAHIFKISPQQGGRLKMMADVGRQDGGITGHKLEFALQNKGRLIFDAPVSFTTGNAKPTEIIIQDGVVKNYLISTEGKDAFIITDIDGHVHVADKRNLWLHDLDAGVSPEHDRRLDITRIIDDYRVFLDMAAKKRISLVSNMLLYDGENISFIEDGKDQRRLFLMFDDGSFGVLNGIVSMSTGEAVRLAVKAGAVKVVYMDTGQFDYTTIRPLGRDPVIWGHSDQRESSNRIGIYLKTDQSDGSISVDKAQDVGGIDLDPSMMDIHITTNATGIMYTIDPAQLQQIHNAIGFAPVIVNIQPLSQLKSFLGAE